MGVIVDVVTLRLRTITNNQYRLFNKEKFKFLHNQKNHKFQITYMLPSLKHKLDCCKTAHYFIFLENNLHVAQNLNSFPISPHKSAIPQRC